MKIVTIKDVANHSGVSISTVSHVVNGTRFVAPETKERVETSITKLGYVANAAARHLKSGKMRTIAMIVERTSNPFFAEVVLAFELECAKQGFLVTISACDSTDESQVDQFQFLKSRGADGFAIFLANISHNLLQELERPDAPPVIALDAGAHTSIPIVNDNSGIGGFLAARHLLDCGRTNALVLGGPKEHLRMSERVDGFTSAWIGANPNTQAPVKHDLQHCSLDFEGGYDAVMRLSQQDQNLNGIDCVMGMNDATAIGAMAALQQLGKIVPDEIAVVGYDDIELCRYVHPQLTTIAQNGPHMGRNAAALLIKSTSEHDEDAFDIPLFEPKLVVRGSSCAPE